MHRLSSMIGVARISILIAILIFPGELATGITGNDSIPSERFTNLGTQLKAAVMRSGLFATTRDGRELVYGVVLGKPARLVGFDISKGNLVVDVPMEGSPGSRGMTVATDGWLYIGDSGGKLFRHIPGTSVIENLGFPLPSERYIWDVVAGEDGEVFGATYPGCRVFRYHPEEGFSAVTETALVEGENYAHSIAYHASARKLYVGVGSHASLIELDPVNGSKRELLPPEYQGKAGFASPVRIVEGFTDGDRLLVQVAGKTLMYNLSTVKLERELPSFHVKAVVKSLTDDRLYYTSGNRLYAYNVARPNDPAVEVAACSRAYAMMWGKDRHLHVMGIENISATLFHYAPATRKSRSVDLDVPKQPVSIHLTATGPGGRIWTGGFPIGTHAAYDPSTGKTENYYGLSQSESITAAGDHLYFGNYPGARLYVYDTRKAWDMKHGNPRQIGAIQKHDRPHGAAYLPDLDKMYFGTVPKYGLLGGALIEYDIRQGSLKRFDDVAGDLSVIKLLYHEGMVIAGTSVYGGMGVKPSAEEASIFGWDPVRHKKIFELIPVPGAQTITSLIQGPDGNVWGVADATLFVFNPGKRKVLSTHQLFETYKPRRWRDFSLVMHPSGKLYGTGNDHLFMMDPESKHFTLLTGEASGLSMDNSGALYFIRAGTELWRYDP